MWSHGMLPTTLWSKYCYPHLTDNDIKVWNGDMTSKWLPASIGRYWERIKPWTHARLPSKPKLTVKFCMKLILKGMWGGGSDWFTSWALEFGVKGFTGDLFSQKYTISYDSWDVSDSCQGQYVSFSDWPAMKCPQTWQHGELGETPGVGRIHNSDHWLA